MQKNEIRVVKYDAACRVEAYQFQGVMQSFPTTFMTITSLVSSKEGGGRS